jgi:hypothetical protein
MIWEREADAYTATMETPAGEVSFHLTVERLSAQSWDWMVWQPGEPTTLARYGTAATAQEAMGGGGGGVGRSGHGVTEARGGVI